MSFVSLAELAGASRVLEIRGQKIKVKGLRLAQIPELLAKHPKLAAALASRDVGNIVRELLDCGHHVICQVIDLACGAPAGTAESADLSAVDEAEILTACVSVTLPESEERVGKFKAELESILSRLGISLEYLMKKADGAKSSNS